MEMRPANFRLVLLISAMACGAVTANAQGTITFDAHNNWVGTDYTELGMRFQVILPRGGDYDYMGIGYGAGNTPQNGTPFMGWFRQTNPYDYISLSLNGSSFGLTSVQLADPSSPSLSPVSISFIGYLAGGSTVTNTFTTPGNGPSTFAAYTFNSDFSSGLTSVDIFAPKWAMDNLVLAVPEPSSLTLAVIGGAGFLLRRRRK